MANTYSCTCKNETFYVRNKQIRYYKDTRIEPVLACTKCQKQYNPQFVSDGGLVQPKNNTESNN